MAQDFTALMTPPPAGRPSAITPVSASSLALVLRLGALFMLAFFVFGNIATWAPLYELQLINTFFAWWKGYPHGGGSEGAHAGHSVGVIDTGPYRNISHTNHTEMIRPTFLFFFCILPFFAGILIIEALNVVAPARRLTASWLWKLSAYMRRKPQLPVLGVSRFTIGEWLFGVVFVLGGNALCFWYEWDRRIKAINLQVKEGTGVLDTAKYFNIVGISFAYVAIYNMAFLLLPVTRNCVWMEFFNVSYANAIKLHRWIGFMTAITSVIHMVGYWVKWTIQGTFRKYQLPCIHCDLSDEFTGYYAWFNTFGFISVLAMLVMIPLSLPVVRRKMYEWFYVSHWVLFIISFFFAILHWGQILWWILPVGILFLISRATSNWNGLAPVVVSSFTTSGPEGEELVKLVVQRSARLSYDYKVGQFVYINVPHISKLQWHALTIASSPKTSATELTLLVKPLGDWSNDLVKYAKECEAAQEAPVVYMDGFFGSSLEHYDEYATLALVGGGIGVTPLLAVLEDIAAKVSRAGSVWTQPRVVFVLAFRELSLLRTVAPVLLKLKELDPSGEYFQAKLYGSRQVLDASLDESYVEQVAPSDVITKKTKLDGVKAREARPFYEPLRSSAPLRFSLFFVFYIVAILVLMGARWGNGPIQGDSHHTLWPLQRTFEFVISCATIVVAYAFIFYEYWAIRNGYMVSDVIEDVQTDGIDYAPSASSDIHSMRDLVSHLGVVFGERPDIKKVLSETLELHNNAQSSTAFLPSVGVLVSGPVPLKQVTNEAVVALGSGRFDVHEEEFEL
ncbi:hypothetical protein Poli38472_004862 [Pythium oligandrum]|uniref:FAD-binding FR-type domain-containing protein n=1 Tax=Pythium oligandrum TaxID=41045 RepID=A0A8K1CB76_PYTOL|nr:hypothetical protein Poli38472_004862 [Pythium oligandrum]|eukprot:TMW59793.1 hypothetical protein Poli38472_004862 [Pythium oligandrum]